MTLIIQLTLLRHHRNIIILHRRTFSTLEYGRHQKDKLRYTGTHNVNLTAEKKGVHCKVKLIKQCNVRRNNV